MEVKELEALIRSTPGAAKVIDQTLRRRVVLETPFGNITGVHHPLFDIEPLPDDFRLLEPRSNLWMRYWKAHSEKQEKMLEWEEMLIGGLFSYA